MLWHFLLFSDILYNKYLIKKSRISQACDLIVHIIIDEPSNCRFSFICKCWTTSVFLFFCQHSPLEETVGLSSEHIQFCFLCSGCILEEKSVKVCNKLLIPLLQEDECTQVTGPLTIGPSPPVS